MREVVAVLEHLLEPVDDLQFLEKRFASVQRYGFFLSGLCEDYEVIRLYDAWSSVLASFADGHDAWRWQWSNEIATKNTDSRPVM